MPQPSPSEISEQFLTEKITVGLPWRILVFSIVIFALSLSIYFGLRFGYGVYLDESSQALDQELKNLSQKVSLEDQQKFVKFYSQLVNLKKVLDAHPFSSNIFPFLEKNTISTVYFNNASLNIDKRTLSLNGFSATVQNLAEQIAVFEKASELETVVIEGVSLTPAGGTNFSVSLTFKPDFFNKPYESLN